MFIKRNSKKVGMKNYQSILLVEGYRVAGKVKHRTVANLSKTPKNIISAIESALNGEQNSLTSRAGKNFGGVYVLYELAKRLSIVKTLGSSLYAKLAMVLVCGRILTQGSRRHLTFWQNGQALKESLGVEKFDTDELYETLDWLDKNQSVFEKKLFKKRRKLMSADQPMFLYDITSSYLEGEKNELARFGYNRDGKRGKRQIVLGLLTDDQGYPISVEVFEGNTSDSTTIPGQVSKLAKEFNVKKVIFVGDRGMIKKTGIEAIGSNDDWSYITAITKPQIESMIKKEVFEIDQFAEDLCEIEYEGLRFVLKRNPKRAEKIGNNRNDQIRKIRALLLELNSQLEQKPKSKIEVAVAKIEQKIKTYKLTKVLSIQIEKDTRKITLKKSDANLQKLSKLDGCYVIKTNVSDKLLDTNEVHDSYKNLKFVEWAFRTMKTTLLELRPIYHRKATRTRGLAFVAMLSYMLIFEIWKNTKNLNIPLEEILASIEQLQTIDYHIGDQWIPTLPSQLRPDQELYFQEMGIKLPKSISI
jgi:transposase